jgi:hypothetical protein
VARARRFYWLWGVALPVLVGVVVYFLAANLTETDMNTRTLRLGFAVGAAVVVFYIAESFYLRREEKLDKRGRRPEDT